MFDFVKASCGEALVIELGEGVYVLSDGEGRCMFAEDPFSFYKFGYYDLSGAFIEKEKVGKVLKHIKKSVQELNWDNCYRCCLGQIKPNTIKEAYSLFEKRM